MSQVQTAASNPAFGPGFVHEGQKSEQMPNGLFAPELMPLNAVSSLQVKDPFQIKGPADIMRLADLSDKLRNTQKGANGSQLTSLEFEEARLKERNLQQAEFRKRAAEAAESQGFWSFLQKIGTFVLSVLTIVTGLFVSSVNPLVGGIMIAAAILNLASAVFQDAGGYDFAASKLSSDEKTRAAIKFILPLIVLLLTATVNILCIQQVGFLMLFQSLDTQGKALEAFRLFALFFGGSASIGEGFAGARLHFAEGELELIKQFSQQSQAAIARIGKAMEHVLSNMRKSTKTISQMLDSHTATMRLLAQKM